MFDAILSVKRVTEHRVVSVVASDPNGQVLPLVSGRGLVLKGARILGGEGQSNLDRLPDSPNSRAYRPA